ncbi:hypothetical protein VB264_11865 [Arcicella aquatica]|uniref:CHAT domain-containing protein n=1 Tax=Arcicella aquatica TaxID=217141 RepID=A0ABU5QN38_9BACT|nr:hypothetical protein [Arcicella aquatica]MEA5258481.1 hypothetical protein [Arcicella aquatica]
MVKVILAYDEDNYTLGQYFAYCYSDISQYFDGLQHGIVEIKGRILNSAYIDFELAKYEEIPFIFIAYSHGTNVSLISDEEYLGISSNLKPFSNSFIYTFSCSSGHTLGNHLIQNGARVFIGYNKEIHIITTYQQIFAECANEGMKHFLSGDNIKLAFQKMKERHNQEIDNIYSKNSLVASTIRKNRDALIMRGHQSNWDITHFH